MVIVWARPARKNRAARTVLLFLSTSGIYQIRCDLCSGSDAGGSKREEREIFADQSPAALSTCLNRTGGDIEFGLFSEEIDLICHEMKQRNNKFYEKF
jgi:hypothetical protein